MKSSQHLSGSPTVTHKGKIARLPYAIRTELNTRLRDGQTGPEILAWLNDLPAVRKRMGELFSGKAVSLQNLSEWRRGGYREWLTSQISAAVARPIICQLLRLVPSHPSPAPLGCPPILGQNQEHCYR